MAVKSSFTWGKTSVKCRHDIPICCHGNLETWWKTWKQKYKSNKKYYNKSSVLSKIWHEGTVWWRIWEMKKKKRPAADSWCLWGNQVEGSMFLDHKMWGKYFDIFPKPTFDDFYPKQRTLQTFWESPPPSPLPPHIPTEPPPPCFDILHLFNYLAATLWFGPELQWKLYLPIRTGLVTRAGQISPSCSCLRERKMPSATLRGRKCHYLIADLSFPAFSLLGEARICMRVKVCVRKSVTQHKRTRPTQRWEIHSWGLR